MNEQRSPFDGKMLIAIAAVLALWFGWQTYLQKKYPDHYKQQAQQAVQKTTENKDAPPAAVTTGTSSATTNTAAAGAQDTAEKQIKFEHDDWAFTVSSKGMSIKDIQLKKYTDRHDQPIVFSGAAGQGNFATNVVGRAKDLDFTVTQPEPNKFVGVAEIGKTRIVKTILVNSATYSFESQVRVESSDENFSGLVTKLSQHIKTTGKGSFFSPSFDHYELYVGHETSYDRTVFDVEKSVSQSYEAPLVASIASQYFAIAAVDQSSVKPELKLTLAPKGIAEDLKLADAEAALSYMVPGNAKDFSIKYVAYAGPKSFELLQNIHPQLANVVNFGFFQSIGKLIFKLMKAIHLVTGNWGLAIVLLTILVRILVLPFNLMSYRSMKGMAKIQPQIKLLRERYKDDAQRLNAEMLQLMKEAKANPLGGCLPMLFQIPVFFALYQVLGQSIELYKAPFGLWIHDLSFKDPYYILPILMGATLFVQQKITPNTMEPAQQKVMMVLPLFFSFMMISLPSGLTLYIFVSGLFGVLQQLYFMRDEFKRERTSTQIKAKA